MKPRSSLLLCLSCVTLSQGIFLASAIAQVIPDGSTNIIVSDLNLSPAFIIPSDTEIPMNLIESEQTFAPVCQSSQSSEQPSGLTIKDQDEVLLILNPQPSDPEIAPIKTSMGDIYPARGVIKTENGQIILTSYPIDNLNARNSHISVRCHK